MEYRKNRNVITRKYNKFFIPTVLAVASSSLALIVDGILAGNMLGMMELAAVNTCAPIMQITMTISTLMGVGASSNISICKGSRDKEKANEVFSAYLTGAIIVGVALLIIQSLFQTQIAMALAGSDELYPYTLEYYRIMLCGTPLFFFVPSMTYILRSEGYANLSFYCLLVSNLLNLFFDVIFMGPLHMGVGGSSLATIVGYAGGLLIFIGYVCSKRRFLHIRFAHIRSCLYEIIVTGTPAAIGLGLVALKVLCINRMAVSIAGPISVTIFTICLSCMSFTSMFVSGASQTSNSVIFIYLCTCFALSPVDWNLSIAKLFRSILPSMTRNNLIYSSWYWTHYNRI